MSKVIFVGRKMNAMSNSLQEIEDIIYELYPDKSIKEILGIYSDREEWFKIMLEGAFEDKSSGCNDSTVLRDRIKQEYKEIAENLNQNHGANLPPNLSI